MLKKIKSMLIHISLGIFFFLILTPIGLITRIFGRDILRLKPNYDESFWIEVNSSKIDSKSFKNQF